MQLTDTILNALEVKVEPFAICDVQNGSRLELEADKATTIHYVLAGKGRLTTGTGDCIDLQADQMILIPEGITQQIESQLNSATRESSASLCRQPVKSIQWLKTGDGGTDVLLACGRIHANVGQGVDMFSMLDQAIVESFDQSEFIRRAFESILLEFCEPQTGTHALASTLMKQCLIIMLRRLLERQDWRIPWLAVMENPGLQTALSVMLNSPEKNHRVEHLAEIACMSRSSFSDHFSRTFGQPPHEFINSYRLRRAAQLLSMTNLPVKSIAAQVGYQSRSSFSRAFKAHFNQDPASYRESMRSH